MKRGTTPTLKIKIDVTNSEVSTIEFLFKQTNSESATALVTKTYPTDVTYDSTNEVYLVSLTEADTRKFAEDSSVYLDTKVTLSNSKIPATEIVQLRMEKTLFGDDDE